MFWVALPPLESRLFLAIYPAALRTAGICAGRAVAAASHWDE